MRWSTPIRRIERAKPLLGTIVRLRLSADDDALGHAAADEAFAEIARIHRLMSFQDDGSDIRALSRAAPGQPAAVDPATFKCLRLALAFAAASDGAFDPVAAQGGGGSWRDLALDRGAVTVARAVTLDLSGIAKGYAVDRACATLRRRGVRGGSVNAGGDLRVFGPESETVWLDAPGVAQAPAAIVVANGAVASSAPAVAHDECGRPQHWDGRTRRPVADGFVSVAAPRCTTADALTKIVLALGEAAAPLLAAYGASAHLHRAGAGWTTIAGQA